jgi:hypothetical protein
METPAAQAEQPHINKLEPRKVEETKVSEDDPKPAPTVEQTEGKTPAPEPVAKEPAQVTPQSTPVASVTCEQAIRQVWPTHLQDGAIIVSQHENRRQDPAAVGAVNKDAAGSIDYGCFQINDHWHPAYFTDGNWQDPVWAAQYALRIYQERQAINGNGWTAWYAVQGILW